MKKLPFLLVLLPACATDATAPPAGPKVHVESFTLQDVPVQWWRYSCCGAQAGFAVDAHGVPTLIVNGQLSYHPTYIANNALVYEDSWEKSQNPLYMDGLKNWINAILTRSDTLEDGAIFAKFDFAFALHGDPAQTLAVGWHSGFTQGMLLSLLVRTYRVTNDPIYSDAADRVFRSLQQTDSRRVAHVDAEGYYWIDEYPLASPDLTLNGYAYAVRGLYEYWQWKKTAESELLLKEALTSLKHYAPQFRVPGQSSVYCLAHHIPAPAYHTQHIELLRNLYQMTGDQSFSQLADEFAADYH